MAAIPIILPARADESPVQTVFEDVRAFKGGKYLTFRVARQDFAVGAEAVRGILPVHEMAPLKTSHAWICGFAALGGHDFPVLDLRAKLGIAHGTRGREPFIIVLETEGKLIGFIADRVSEVLELRARDFRQGQVRGHGRPRRVLETDLIMTPADWSSFWLKPSL